MFNSSSNAQVLEQLNKLVHGHDRAKKVLINLVNRAKTRYYQIHGLMIKEDDRLLTPMNMFLIGKSGTGKTHLVESLSKICDFPLYKIDATQLTMTSASDGLKLENVLTNMRKWAQNIVDSSPKGKYFSAQGVLDQTIVFVDEMDKMAARGSEGWNQRVQAHFLRFFENKVDGFNSLSFVFAGAFMGLDRTVDKPVKQSIGFFKQAAEEKKEVNRDNDIIKEGLLPEIVGRIHHVVELDTLTKDDYKFILQELMVKKKNDEMLFLTGEALTLTDEQVGKIVDSAYESEQGIRAMGKALEEHVVDLEFNSYKHDNIF